jgi:hypothetical protein
MLAILSIIIGIVFVLLLFSMLTSAVVEVYHAFFKSRGKHLRDTLTVMLGEKTVQEFMNHAYFQQLSSVTHKPKLVSTTDTTSPKSDKQTPKVSLSNLPIWIDKGTFSSILADILTKRDSNETIQQRIDAIPDVNLRKVLDFLWRQSGDDIQLFQAKVENWFTEIMERAKDWFGDATKWRLFFIGLGLAGMLNADTVQIYKSLSANAATRDELVKVADSFVGARSSIPGIDTTKTYQQAKADFLEIKNLYTENVQSPLGLGWGQALPVDIWAWLTKILGWMLTGVAVTMGAPFWFEMLKKLLSLRGNKPEDTGDAANRQNRGADAPPPSVFEIKPKREDDVAQG